MRVLFVCTGNTCRSPMAEGLLRRLSYSAGFPIEARSAGIAAFDGSAYAAHAVTVLAEQNTPLSGRSQRLTWEWLKWADFVFTMTAEHKKAVLSEYPQCMDKVHLLKEFVLDDFKMKKRLAALNALYNTAEKKRAQFFAEHVTEINELEERYRESGSRDEGLATRIKEWHNRLRQVTVDEEAQISELEKELPHFDIADPVGGGVDDYRRTRDELGALLKKLIEKLKTQEKRR